MRPAGVRMTGGRECRVEDDALVRHVRRWAAFHGLAAAERPRQAVAIATYAGLCAPAGATGRQLEVAAELTALFFHLDDASPEIVARAVAASRAGGASGLPALDAFLAGFAELHRVRPGIRDRFLGSLHVWFSAILEEIAIDFATIAFERHLDLRRRNAFIDPYVDGWLVLLELDIVGTDAIAARHAREAARDVIILANDLGSWQRDRDVGGELADPSLVATHMREAGTDEEAALAWTIARHDAAVADLDRWLAGLRDEPDAHRYAALLTAIVAGNVEAMRRLGDRYQGSAAVLDRLRVPQPRPAGPRSP